MEYRGIDGLLRVMARLRDPQHGCPWDVAQNFRTVAPYTIEEAYEVADAIARDDMKALCDELGDLLLQVVFHAQMAQERAAFDFESVVAGIVAKMIRRHPHVFAPQHRAGEAGALTAEDQTVSWEAIKEDERRARGESAGGALDGVGAGMPALIRSLKLQRRAARVGFDWPRPQPVLGKLHEEVAELEEAMLAQGERDRVAEEIGDVLFTVVNLARHLEVDCEMALQDAASRFERRFKSMEAQLSHAPRGSEAMADLAPEELERLWRDAKTEVG